MNKFKKIGLTALAGSLVATSAFAGSLSATGAASIGVSNITGTNDQSTGKDWSMGNSVILGGSGELDNGMTVSMSFELDANVDAGTGTGPFDNHSVTVSSDAMGTLTFSGHGGSSAQSAIDTTAAGDIWDNGFTYTGANTKYTAMAGSDANNDKSINYTFPTIMDDLALAASYSGTTTATNSTTAWSATYTGIEGLSVSYGSGEAGSTTATSAGDVTTMKGSYAIGSFTAAYSNTESDKDSTGTDEEMSSFKISYTVTDDLSISYGEETHETSGESVDEEFEAISVSYTTGGMTLTAAQYDASGLGNTSGNTAERWKLGASFAF